jgi:hypothetical protein
MPHKAKQPVAQGFHSHRITFPAPNVFAVKSKFAVNEYMLRDWIFSTQRRGDLIELP